MIFAEVLMLFFMSASSVFFVLLIGQRSARAQPCLRTVTRLYKSGNSSGQIDLISYNIFTYSFLQETRCAFFQPELAKFRPNDHPSDGSFQEKKERKKHKKSPPGFVVTNPGGQAMRTFWSVVLFILRPFAPVSFSPCVFSGRAPRW